MSRNRWESVAHVAMGFGAGLVNLRLLLSLREWRQLPPENDQYPVIWAHQVDAQTNGEWAVPFEPSSEPVPNWTEYWAKARVLDTLRDSWEYRVGETIAWFVVVAASVALGAWFF